MPLAATQIRTGTTRRVRAPALALVGLASVTLVAAQIRPLTIEELATRATRIHHGRVEAIEVTQDKAGAPFTRIELAVDATWKGTPTNRIAITQAGGTLGTRRVLIPGDAQYQPGEEVVVFLTSNRLGEWLTLELAQGKFSVQRTDPTNAWARNLIHGGTPGDGGFRPRHLLPLQLVELQRRVSEAKP